jgi:hypothetical protein
MESPAMNGYLVCAFTRAEPLLVSLALYAADRFNVDDGFGSRAKGLPVGRRRTARVRIGRLCFPKKRGPCT